MQILKSVLQLLNVSVENLREILVLQASWLSQLDLHEKAQSNKVFVGKIHYETY